jgi:hypothetical protein
MDSRFVPHVLYGLYPQPRKAGEAGEAIRAPLVSANRKPAKLNPQPATRRKFRLHARRKDRAGLPSFFPLVFWSR